MKIKRVVLSNFRNYKLSAYDFGAEATLIFGPNAVGKTSIVEAIHLLSTGDSFRSGKIDEMVSIDTEVSRVSCKLVEANDESEDSEELEILLNRGNVGGRRTQKRLYTLNGAKKRKKDFIGKFYSVVFRPEDMRLIEGSKTRRRKFMDEALIILDWQYARSLKMYEEALVKRNKLLWQIKEKLVPKTTLKYWNMTVLKHGQYLQKKRKELLDFFSQVDFPLPFRVSYRPSIISQERQAEYEFKEIASGHSLIGPHKDDFLVFLDDKNKIKGKSEEKTEFDLATYGSRGQQRMSVLWLKICQLSYIEVQSNQKALLLLDDILSELDEMMIEKVLGLLADRQSIITSADSDAVEQLSKYINSFNSINLSEEMNNGTKF
jgi:DNA replication and repair protein RecF